MKYKQIIKKISKVIHDWDPLAPTPSDEYDELSIELYKRMIKGGSERELETFFADYLTNYMSIEYDQTLLKDCLFKIMSLYEKDKPTA